MDVVVKGRNVEVPEHFRALVAEKLRKLERYDHKLIEVDVELLHERNPRQTDSRQRVEITCVSRGPVVRAEASSPDFYGALDKAMDKINTRLRRAAERRRTRRTRRAPIPVGVPIGEVPRPPDLEPRAALDAAEPDVTDSDVTDSDVTDSAEPEGVADAQPWHIARMKEHPADPMTVDDALFRMELVGHDFYLFQDKDSGQPSVVYRRKGYDYGVISLAPPATATG